MKKLIPILSLLIISVAGFAQTQTKRTIQIWDDGTVKASRDILFVDSITFLTEIEAIGDIILPTDEFGNYLWTPYLSADGNHGNPLIGDMTHSTDFPKIFADNALPDNVGDEIWSAVLFAQPELGTYNDDRQFPLYITIDLGRAVTIDSFLFKCRERRGTSGNIGLGSSRYATDFEVWGSKEPINPELTDTVQSLNYWTSWQGTALNGTSAWESDGSWTKLHTGTLESILPSGIKYHSQWTIDAEGGGKELSEEDQAAILAGFKFYLDGTTEVQYLRFKISATSSGTQVNEWQYLELHGAEK